MCGLAGVIVPANAQTPATELAQTMATRIAHRGPDDAGVWADVSGRIALAHRRLSIHDLSPAGHQPMVSPDGRYVGVFNGAIHNFRDVRATLEQAGIRFRSTSDTEVLLAAVQHWGFVRGLQHLSGMFAIGVWDNRDRKLYLARDRAGQKPLYYGNVGQVFAFGSELKAFLALPGFERRIDPRAVQLYVSLTHIPSPYCIYQGLNKLPPGHYAEITEQADVKVHAYWQRAAFKPTAVMDYATARRQAEALLIQSVSDRLAADVPLGAFLSGGFDSTAVVALMQAHATSRVRTFTIASADPAYNEGEHARAVATHLGTEHTEFKVEAKDALGVVGDLPAIYDEPFADASQVPTVLIARLARRHVIVALTGDGGDEVFGGYNRHVYGPALWRLAKRIPRAGRAAVARLLARLPRVGRVSDQVEKVARGLSAESATDFYRALVRCWETEPLAHPGAPPPLWYQTPDNAFSDDDVGALMMHLDFVGYLGDGVLTKVDRATMSVALEVRTPFLDDRLVEFMARLPMAYKVRGGVSKRLLRELVYARVPRKLVDRPKSGFDVPVDAWLRGPLKDWAADLLDAKALREGGLLDADAVGRVWDQHQRGVNRDQQLWCILMFQAWLRHAV